MSDIDCDVTILGGGLVGSAAALALDAHGFSTALLDPVPIADRADPDFDGRAYMVAPGSMLLLRMLGIWERLAEHAEPVHEIIVTDGQTGPVAPATLHFDPAEVAGGTGVLGWIIEDRWLRTALLDALDASTVSHRAPARGTAVEPDVGGALVRCDDGTGINTRLVVACDGRRSATARAAGIRYLAWSYGQVGLVSAISHEHPHGGLARQSFFAGGPFAVLPLPGRRSSLVWSETDARAAELAALPDAAYLDEIAARLGGALGEIELAGRRWSHPLGLSLAMRYAAPRLVVAGDAAHGVHPIAGQGMNMGLRDVAALAEVLVEAGRRGEDIGAAHVLERYEAWRRPDATFMALGMDGINRLFSTSRGPVQMLRNIGLRAVAGSGWARRRFMEIAAGSAGDVPKMLRGLPI